MSHILLLTLFLTLLSLSTAVPANIGTRITSSGTTKDEMMPEANELADIGHDFDLATAERNGRGYYYPGGPYNYGGPYYGGYYGYGYGPYYAPYSYGYFPYGKKFKYF
ncbi:unnamed protein product [Agarophyton chilense]|eukprot:gb/GEZJ01009226.1/.p1 GENE.gb/GEZJ01009226.1/~~gb/GEZJ01009226.1/.p1  ORF type:complete len:108 (-),score=5.56 gb/GEZJ01009226.1/:82-405(-)